MSVAQRMQSRGHSPRTISNGRTEVVRHPAPGGRGSPPLRCVGKYHRRTGVIRPPTKGAWNPATYGGLYTLRCGMQRKGTARPPTPSHRLPHFSADSAPYLWYNSLKSRAALGQAHSALRICARKCDLRLLHHSQNREAVLRRQSRRAQAALQLAAMVQCHQAPRGAPRRTGLRNNRRPGFVESPWAVSARTRRAGDKSEREALRRRGKGGPQ